MNLPEQIRRTLSRNEDPWQPVIAAWLAEVGQRSGSERTPAEYRSYLARFLDLVGDPARATSAHVHAFAYGPGATGRQPSPSTTIVRLAAIRSFYDFAKRMGLVDDNPTQGVRRPRNQEPMPRGVSGNELQKLLSVIPDSPEGLRDRAIILTATLTGLRRTEVISLTAGCLSRDDSGRVYYVARVKGGQERRRELPPPALAAMVEALEARGERLEGLGAEDYIFRIAASTFYDNLRRYGRRAGLGNLRIHDLRHSAAKLRRETGGSIEDVSGFLGHRNISTTARYLARLEGEQDSGWQGAARALGLDGQAEAPPAPEQAPPDMPESIREKIRRAFEGG